MMGPPHFHLGLVWSGQPYPYPYQLTHHHLPPIPIGFESSSFRCAVFSQGPHYSSREP